ncbi:MAG: hypothetical protein Q4F13_02770 [Pseudomonadota bacterium]|nr:hypothetical protein [Pseudomonadota bacterium]
MLGFPQALKNLGGVVRGKGTETSDSNHGEIAEGSYVMPADSTREIGEKNMAAMGIGKWAKHDAKDVPVALSKGEYVMPPEQVHAVGAQALDAIRDATHQPVARGLRKPDVKRALLADGGLAQAPLPAFSSVDEARKAIAQMQAASRVKMAQDGALSPFMAKPAPAPAPAPADGFRTFSNADAARNELARMHATSRANMARYGALPPSMVTASSQPQMPRERQYLADGGLATEDELRRQQMAGGGTAPTTQREFRAQQLAQQQQARAASRAEWMADYDRAAAQQAAEARQAAATRLQNSVLRPYRDPTAAPASPAASPLGARAGDAFMPAMDVGKHDFGAQPKPSATAQGVSPPAAQGESAGQWGGSSWIKRAAPQQFASAAGENPFGLRVAGAQPSVGAQSGQAAVASSDDGTIRFDRATNTYSGKNIGPDAAIEGGRQLGGSVSNGVDSGAASAQRVAQIYRSMAAGNGAGQGISVPTVSRSGNDWGARNDLRSARISASSMTNQPGYGGMIRGRHMIGGVQGKSAAQAQYESLLAADQAARGANATLAQEGMRQQGGLMQEAARQRGQLQQAQMQAGTERAKLGLAERQQAELERNGVIERGVAELGLNQAMRLEQAQRDYDSASTPEARETARQRLMALQGKQAGGDWVVHVTPSIKNADGSISEGSVIRSNRQTGQVERVNVAAPLPPISENPQAIAIKNNGKLSTEQKAEELRKLGYTEV